MSRPLFPNSVAYRPDGEPWAYAPFALELLTTPAERASAAYPTRPIYKFSTDANGAFATDLTINTPETGAWLWRLWWPDRRYIDAYIEQGDGSAIEMDDWVTLAGQAGSAAGTPAAEFLNGLYTAVSGADDGLLLQTESGSLDLTNAPGGYWMQRTAVPEGETVTIPTGYQMIVYGDFTAVGDLVAIGDLVIL